MSHLLLAGEMLRRLLYREDTAIIHCVTDTEYFTQKIVIT